MASTLIVFNQWRHDKIMEMASTLIVFNQWRHDDVNLLLKKELELSAILDFPFWIKLSLQP